ncbi:Disco-interacting protein 2 -like protein A [Triplophysa tibetana]|uniref:Disco-interacting protein 2-like protein A n=1 Tax=Triplophysa tibetana TaxID=1572043 RepID=A0A5A9P3E9_9TELE|nr:Disco-interacting protein 2 -like protein A [Triplophysa tibetana]
MLMSEPSTAVARTLPAEVREKLAELELELSEACCEPAEETHGWHTHDDTSKSVETERECDITQKGYEKKRGKLLAPYIPQIQGVDPSLQIEHRIPSQVNAAGHKHNKSRVTNSRDERFRSDTSSASEDEGSLRRQGQISSSSPYQSQPRVEHWFNKVLQGSSTSSSASSTTSHPGGRSHHATSSSAATVLADLMSHTHNDTNNSAPPDVTGLSERSLHVERPQVSSVRGIPRGYMNTSVMETADGVPVNSRVSSKIQQLLNTLKRPKRPPLPEFFIDDFEELLDVQHPDPDQPKPEGGEMRPLDGEPLEVMTNWPSSLLSSLRHWGTTQPKSPCLTALDNAGKAVYTLTYGKLWTRSVKLAYTLLNKLSSRNHHLLMLFWFSQVALVFPNNDPVMFMVAFYGCLLAELVPVPIEVPLTRKDAGSQQVGFLLGSCGVTLALTSDACQKGLPKAQTGEVVTFKGEIITNVLDFKRDAGLWHGVLTSVMNRLHVISIPYSLMKVNPLSWIQKVHTYKARVAVVKSRDMHWSLLAQREQRDISLSSLRILIVADGANPWSISSCDAFLNVFQSRGLRPEVICPCASSSEAMTVALRRPPEMCVPPPGKAVLSMSALSYGVIRVDTEEKLSVLTVQDVGQVMPGGISYYGLPGMTKNVFETIPVTSSGTPISDRTFTRTSLLGFIGPMDGLMVVTSRKHNADDVVATALAVEPMKFVYRGRIAVFSVSVLHDERIVVVAEQRPDASEEDSFQWMSRVLQAIDSIHQVGVYCLALVPANTLPKAPLGGIHISETKQRFLEGALHPCNVLMCPHTCVTNLPKPRQKQPGTEVGPASMMVGNLVAGKRMAQASGRDVSQLEDTEQFLYMQDVLQWRAQATPDHPLFLLLNAKVSKSVCILTTQAILKLLKSKEAAAAVDIKSWPLILDTDDLPRKRIPQIYKPHTPDLLAYLDFSVSTTGILAGVKMSHAATSALCRSIKLQCELYPSRQITICLDPYCGLGLALWCLCSVYSGHQSILVPPLELESNASLWLSAVSQYKVRVTFCSYSVMEMCTKGLGSQTEALRLRNVNLACVRTCMVVAEERPRNALTQSFSTIFKDLGLSTRAVSTTFGCRVNVAVCLQQMFISKLTQGNITSGLFYRRHWVRLVEKGSPHSLALMESGKILPGVKVIIANTETKGPLGDSHLGEIWVSSPHNASGYYTVYGEEALHADHFSTRLSFGDTHTVWARTGYLGFLRRTELTDASGERHDALYVIGSLDETLELRGMRYHPIDIETSVIRAHKSIAECAVFTWTNLLVVVVELEGSEQEALDLVALVTNVVLEEHYLIVGVVVVVDPGVIPINSRGEKQRMHLRDGFLADQLDPIYVAYNM